MPRSHQEGSPSLRYWRADSIDPPDQWTIPLPAACQEILASAVNGRGFSAEHHAELAEGLAPARQALERGRGFAIVEAPALMAGLSTEAATAAYWLAGKALGAPVAQNVQGTMLYDVRDTGRSLTDGARFSVTNYESSFHTDNSFGDAIVDYVGLLCLHSAKSGGVSQALSGYPLLEELKARDPETVRILSEPFHVDRRGGSRAGESPTVLRPVIDWDDDGGLVLRYLRYWIEEGHRKANQPLTAAQIRALDLLDQVAGLPELRVDFMLQPGQMYFINNRWILHNRTAFEDYPEIERRRHLVRLWLERRDRDVA